MAELHGKKIRVILTTNLDPRPPTHIIQNQKNKENQGEVVFLKGTAQGFPKKIRQIKAPISWVYSSSGANRTWTVAMGLGSHFFKCSNKSTFQPQKLETSPHFNCLNNKNHRELKDAFQPKVLHFIIIEDPFGVDKQTTKKTSTSKGHFVPKILPQLRKNHSSSFPFPPPGFGELKLYMAKSFRPTKTRECPFSMGT